MPTLRAGTRNAPFFRITMDAEILYDGSAALSDADVGQCDRIHHESVDGATAPEQYKER
jgi:hypothetical protein